MTDQEIEKLREKLGSDYSVKRLNGAITVELTDIWKGVEFASHIFDDEVYRVSEIVGDKIWNTKGTWLSKKVAKPSTESAYVEQLKAKAKELFGEIKDGDRFWIDENLGEVSMYDCEDGFSYWKEEDLLYFGNYAIYSKGKWAKKVEESIRVSFSHVSFDPYPIKGKLGLWFCLVVNENDLTQKLPEGTGRHLAKCLEDYLNKS